MKITKTIINAVKVQTKHFKEHKADLATLINDFLQWLNIIFNMTLLFSLQLRWNVQVYKHIS